MTFLECRGGKISKSRGATADVPHLLSMNDPNPLRLHLTATVPETRDTAFSWEDFNVRYRYL